MEHMKSLSKNNYGEILTAEEIEFLALLDKIDCEKKTPSVVDRNEYVFFTDEENHYLDTHENKSSGEITNFTQEDLDILFNK